MFETGTFNSSEIYLTARRRLKFLKLELLLVPNIFDSMPHADKFETGSYISSEIYFTEHHEPNFFKLYLLIVPKFILQNAAGENLKTVTFITPKIILKGGRRSNILKQDIFLCPYKYYKNAPHAKIIKKTGIISEVLIPESLHPNPSRYFITSHICLSKIEGIRYAHNLWTIYIIFTHTVNGFYIKINTHILSYSS